MKGADLASAVSEFAFRFCEVPFGSAPRRFEENRNMRRRVSSLRTPSTPESGASWIDLGRIATVEVSSEDPKFPIESVFAGGDGSGWRAAQKGEQQIRLIFDQPLTVRRIQLRFQELTCDRQQEFTLRWLAARDRQPREILRQLWNFNPAGSTRELEDHEVNLEAVSVLELAIIPDLTRNQAFGNSRRVARGLRVAKHV
jgi:hypothetical protein